MRSKTFYFFAGICTGLILGGTILIYLYNRPPEQIRKDDSKEILDFVIDSWTNPGLDTIFIASLGNNKEEFEIGKIPDTVRALAAWSDSVYKIPKGVVIAQWILESKWGLCNLGAENYFGMTLAAVKKYLPKPKYVIQPDIKFVNGTVIRERVRFARFKNIAECFSVHAQYIAGSKLYANAFKFSKRPERFARSTR